VPMTGHVWTRGHEMLLLDLTDGGSASSQRMLTGENDRSRVYRGLRRFHLVRRNDISEQRTNGTG
jgi:hypothetical protein